MTWGELLEELATHLLRDRSDLQAGPSDQLWSDEQLLSYLADAERRFARRTMILRDGDTEAVTRFSLRDGVSEYTLHPAVLAVISAKLEDDSYDLARVGHSALDGRRTTFPTYVWPEWAFTVPTTPGRPGAYLTDDKLVIGTSTQNGEISSTNRVSLRFDRVPTSEEDGVEVQLRVVRLPLYKPTTDRLDCYPEIPEDHHLDLLEWAAYRALRNYDSDAESRGKSKDHEERFKAAMEEARSEALKKLFAPAGWGFGAAGWGWTTNNGSEW